jgi:hypothetical protein
LKARGGWGVLMDACGAHLLPTLWTVSLIAEGAGKTLSAPFAAAIGVWSLALGLRGILRHQMMDRDRDRQVGLRTFAAKAPDRLIPELVRWAILPAELAALAMLLGLAGSFLPWVLLALDQTVEALRTRFLQARFTTAGAEPGLRVLLAEYYELFYPLGFLLILAQREPAAWALTAIHSLLFIGPILLFQQDARIVTIRVIHQVGRFVVHRLRGARQS